MERTMEKKKVKGIVKGKKQIEKVKKKEKKKFLLCAKKLKKTNANS